MEDVKKDEQVERAMGKLKKDKVDVSINPKRVLLEFSKGELKNLEEAVKEGLSEEQLKIVEDAKKAIQAAILNYEKSRIEAVMVPLKYKDAQVVKSGIYEALDYQKEFNWDENNKTRAMIREEHTLTVYLTLRKKDDIDKRYYATLEDIVKETESAIEELYRIYADNFVLGDDQRKNS